MKTMKHIQILFYLILAILVSSCKPQIPDPETDAVYKSITRIYELNEDGTSNFQYQHQLKYLTHFSFNRLYGETFVIYNPEKQSLKINKAETTTEDGRIIPSPENAFNEVLPRFAAGAPAFNHLREMVITHTGLELNCIVNLDFEIKSEKDFVPFFEKNIVLTDRSPIQNMKIVVKIPADKKLHYKLLNSSVEPIIKTKKGVSTYTWEFNQIEPMSFESNQPHYNESAPRLIFSTVSLNEAFENVAVDNSISDEIKTMLEEKIADKKTSAEKVFALQNIVVNEINLFDIPLEYAGYKTRENLALWKTNGATELEKTFLLSAMLNKFNIEAKPIMAFAKSAFDKNIGVLKNTGHSYIFCTIDEKPFVISATSAKAKNNLLFDLKDEVLVNMEGDVLEYDKAPFSDNNELAVSCKLWLSKDATINGNGEALIKGKINPYFEFLKDEKYAKRLAGEMIGRSNITNAETLNWNEKESKIKFEFKAEKAAKEQANYLFLTIPESALGINAAHLDVLTENRASPMQINAPLSETYEFKMTIPSTHALVSQEVDTTLQNTAGEVHIKIAVEGNGIEIYRKLLLNKKIIPSEEYADFRDLYLLWNNKKYTELVLKE